MTMEGLGPLVLIDGNLRDPMALTFAHWNDHPVGVDVNSFENVWDLAEHRPEAWNLGSARKRLIAAIEEREALRARPETVAALYNSMPSRMGQVIAAEGRSD
ncbi:hypothetical protein HPB50_020833 [Hyalomma asiaticum]|uniref:Uncharacterized protein n=1 Tax=Hyalomma asiaticum TaxID=266040 RepID=A0ACB7S1H2_HYAAI|nr:hypothetical protein HPB50_020833 [Hyalomma asiaticum]